MIRRDFIARLAAAVAAPFAGLLGGRARAGGLSGADETYIRSVKAKLRAETLKSVDYEYRLLRLYPDSQTVSLGWPTKNFGDIIGQWARTSVVRNGRQEPLRRHEIRIERRQVVVGEWQDASIPKDWDILPAG